MNRVRNVANAIANRDRYCIALIAVIVFLFFLPTLVDPTLLIWPHSGLGSDIAVRHWPDLIRYATNWSQGHVPIWDSSSVLGRPLAGDPAVLFLYPFDIVFAWLPPAFAFNLLNALHIFIASLWTFLLMRRGYNITRPAALVSAFTFAFSPKIIAHLAGGHVGLVWSIAWAPAVLWGLKIALNGKLYGAMFAGLALAIHLPNHLQMPYYTAVLVSAYWAWNLLAIVITFIRSHHWEWKRISQLFLIYAVWIGAFILFSAVTLFPLLELLPYNSRGGFTLEDANLYALPPLLLVTLLVPSNFQFPEWMMFVGLSPLVLAAVGWFSKQHRKIWLFFAIFLGLALVYSLGASTPLFGAAFTWVPGFNVLRVPTRLWFLGGLAVAILAGLGVDLFVAHSDLRAEVSRRWPWMVLAVAVYFGGLLVGWFGYRVVSGSWHGPMLLRLVTAVLLFGTMYLWNQRRLSGIVFQWAAIAILLVDLLPLNAVHIDLVNPQTEFAETDAIVDYLDKQDGLFRVYSPAGDFPYALTATHKIEVLEGLLSLQITPSVDAIRLATGCTRQHYATAVPACLTDLGMTALPDPGLLGKLNVRYIVSQQPLDIDQFSLLLTDRKFLYENLAWQPRARLENGGEVEIVKYTDGEFEINVDSDTATTLVVAETWLPGWIATVNGVPQATRQVANALIGVEIGASQSVVTLSYQPLGWQIGWRTTVISLLLLFAGLAVHWVRNTKHSVPVSTRH